MMASRPLRGVVDGEAKRPPCPPPSGVWLSSWEDKATAGQRGPDSHGDPTGS